jgi:hypothetical protein
VNDALAPLHAAIPSTPDDQIEALRRLEQFSLERVKQEPATTHHLLHAGMYHRTVMMPAGSVLTGAEIKRATTLVVHGDVETNIGRITGHAVLPASAHRKQMFIAYSDTWLTMSFPTLAQTVEQAEEEFTDEAHLLFSRYNQNIVVITGE